MIVIATLKSTVREQSLDKSEAATAAFVKHKCYSLTSLMYYLKRPFRKFNIARKRELVANRGRGSRS